MPIFGIILGDGHVETIVRGTKVRCYSIVIAGDVCGMPAILLDNCIYFLRAYEKGKSDELYETVESSREIYRILNSEKDIQRFVTTIKLIKTKNL